MDTTRINHNNSGHKYRIAVDIAKEGSHIWDLTPYFKGRVGDNNFGLQVTWYYQGQLMNVVGMKPYIEGLVGQYSFDKNGEIDMDPDAVPVRYDGSPDDCEEAGKATFYFPSQMFPKEGIFKGFIGVKDDRDGSKNPQISGVTIWFKVLPGIVQMGHACDAYVDELDKALQNFKDRLDQHDKDYQSRLQKVIDDARNAYNTETKNAHDGLIAMQAEIDEGRGNATHLAGRVADMLTQIKDNDIVTIHDHQEDISKISAAINDRLKNMKTTPVGIADAQTLQNTYPNGADGLFVTLDNKHLYMWLNGQWSDAGPYESAQLDKKVEQSIGDVKSAVLKENLIKNGSFSDGTLDGVWGELGSDKLNIFNFLNRNWACLQSDTAEAYHGFDWWIDSPLKNLGQNYPFHIEFDLVTAQPMTLDVNLVPFDHENNRLGGMTIKTITTKGWEFKHFDVDFGIDDKYINADHFYFQIVQPDGKPVQEMRVTGVICYLKYHEITNLHGNLIENGDFSNGLAYPAYSDSGKGALSVIDFASQKWLDFQSPVQQAYQGVDWVIANPIKELGQDYPLKLKLKLATSQPMTVDINLIAYNAKGERIGGASGGQTLRTLHTQGWRFTKQEINFRIYDQYKNADYFVLQILQPDNTPVEHLRITDLDLRVVYDQVQYTKGNLIADSSISNGVVSSQVSSNTGDGNLSVLKFENHNWLSFTSDKSSAYQGLSWQCSNPITELGQNYPLRIKFTLITAENMTLQADIIGYDAQGKQVGSVLLSRFSTKAWRSVTYDFTTGLSGDLSNAAQLYLQIIQLDAKAVKEIRVTDIVCDVVYDGYSTLSTNLIKNGDFAGGIPEPAYGDTGNDQLSVINYLNKNWLKVVNSKAEAYGGPQWEIKSNPDYFDQPLQISFDLMTAEDMTLNLNAAFFDAQGQRIGGNGGGQVIDQIKTKGSQIITYSNRFKLDPTYRTASLIHLQLVNPNTTPIKQIILTDICLTTDFDQVKVDQVTPIKKPELTITDLENKYGLPIMRINGDVSGMDHDHAKNVTYEFKNKNTHLTGYATLKWQGDSSATLAKKGYRLKTTKDDYKKKDEIRVQPSWQKHSKFNLKAYYNDGMLSRDPISANIGGQVSASRPTLPRDLIHEDNFGYIDGFPIILFINNEYQGLYSFNLTRPSFDYTKWAIMGSVYNDTTLFVNVPTDGVKLDGSDFVSLNPEDTPTDEEKKAVTDLFKWMVNSTDDEFKRDLDKHFNIQSLIDYVVVSNILGARDAAGKNQILMTWDGKIWYYQLYDLDCTYNANWMGGKTFDTPKVGVDLPFLGNNQFLLRFAKLYHNAIADRYCDVRQWCTPGYILSLYKQRINLIGQENFEEEWAKWNDPSKDTEDFKQLQNDLYDHFKAADFVWLGNNPENTTYQIKPDTPPAPQTQPASGTTPTTPQPTTPQAQPTEPKQ